MTAVRACLGLVLLALTAEARASCVASSGIEVTLFGATDLADAIVVAEAGPAHHGHVDSTHHGELSFEMKVVRVLKDVTGRVPERFFQRGWWSNDPKRLPADFTVPRTYCETPTYRVGGLYLLFLSLDGDKVRSRMTSPQARLDGEVDDLADPLVRAALSYLAIQQRPGEGWRAALKGLLETVREGGELAPLGPDIENVLAFEGPLSWSQRTDSVDVLAERDPAEALRYLMGRSEQDWNGRDDELVARLRSDGVSASEEHLWRLPARHAPWITESLSSLLEPKTDTYSGRSRVARVARWYLQRDLPGPEVLLAACRRTDFRGFSQQIWCDSLLAESGDEDIVLRASEWLELGGGLRRHGPRAARIFSVSPLPRADTALRSLLSTTLDRLGALDEADLPSGTETRRRQGFERLLKAWVWAQLDSPLDLATTRVVDFVAHLDTVPFTACTVREVLEQRPEIEGAVLPLLDEEERSLLDACLLREPPARLYSH